MFKTGIYHRDQPECLENLPVSPIHKICGPILTDCEGRIGVPKSQTNVLMSCCDMLSSRSLAMISKSRCSCSTTKRQCLLCQNVEQSRS